MVEVERKAGAIIVKFTDSQLQMYLIPQLKAAVQKLIDEKPARIIFDLETVEHLDSSAMGAIFHFQRKVREHQGRISLVHVSNKVMQIFKITKSDGHLEVFDTLEHALKA